MGGVSPQFVIPAGPIGEFLGAPVIDWNLMVGRRNYWAPSWNLGIAAISPR